MIIYQAHHTEKLAFYIGKTTKTLSHRRRKHEYDAMNGRTGSYFHKAIKKHGIEAFEWVTIKECCTIEEMNHEEMKWIALLNACNHEIYNLTAGGDGGDCGGSQYWKNNVMPDDMRKRISDSLKEYYATHENPMKGKTSPFNGREHTEESRTKISASKLGKRRCDMDGAKNPSAKPIRCITTGESFDYAKLAAIKNNLDLSSIIKCCKGKLKTCGGKVFEYIQPDLV